MHELRGQLNWAGFDDTTPRSADSSPGAVSEVEVPRIDEAAPRYELNKTLGQGGMGRVLEVLDVRMDRHVAMKVMHPEVAETDDGRRRFWREARIQSQLEHPAIVPVYDLTHDASGMPCFTMKRVRGHTLERVLDELRSGAADVKERSSRRLLTAFVQVCLAIDFAHSRGVLHRDLKPGNIMLGDFGDVHVLDWGLAQVGGDRGPARDLVAAMEQVARGGSVFGTPGYMAPEQIDGRAVGRAADVYSLGAILFELLTLEPLNGGNLAQRLAHTQSGEGRSPAARAPASRVPPELDAAVLAATEVDPSRRTNSARALAEAVESYLDGDRDETLRLLSARRHLDAARPIIAGLDTATVARRDQALNHLLSALALDPGNDEGLAMLRELLSHAPRTLPGEFEADRARREGMERASLARIISARMGMWTALTPLVWAMGAVDVTAGLACTGAVLGAFFFTRWAGACATLSKALLGGVLGCTALSLLALAAVFGSFLLVPAMATIALMLVASHLGGRTRLVFISVLAGVVLLPFAAEELGVLRAMHVFTSDSICVVPRVMHFAPLFAKLVLTLGTLSQLVLPAVMASRLRERVAAAEQKSFFMAWQLERLSHTSR